MLKKNLGFFGHLFINALCMVVMDNLRFRIVWFYITKALTSRSRTNEIKAIKSIQDFKYKVMKFKFPLDFCILPFQEINANLWYWGGCLYSSLLVEGKLMIRSLTFKPMNGGFSPSLEWWADRNALTSKDFLYFFIKRGQFNGLHFTQPRALLCFH